MAFVWDLIQQFQLHSTKSRAKSAATKARSAEVRAKVAETRSRSAESRTRSLESRIESLEDELEEVRTTVAVLLDRLERRFGADERSAEGPQAR
jgi:predicted RNase H-like nuclease (RuvC/YqgF family)